jgi:hypothetical protein
MTRPYEIYDLLQDYAARAEPIREVLIGLIWTYCDAGAFGLAMSPAVPTRTLPWAGSLRGKPVAELARWVREFEPYAATVGMAAVNAAINRRWALPEAISLDHGNLAVFEHFLPLIQGKKTVVIGRYPGLEAFAAAHGCDLTVLERNPGPSDVSDVACEYLLPDAEWVFLTASSIPNKTFPRLAELSRNATTVLMGPTTPWLPDFYHFGVDYLAGVAVTDADALRATVAEGGGVRLFDEAVCYQVVPLTAPAAMTWTQQRISQTVTEKEVLTRSMEAWYSSGNTRRFPRYAELDTDSLTLSRLDTCFKTLWDQHGK